MSCFCCGTDSKSHTKSPHALNKEESERQTVSNVQHQNKASNQSMTEGKNEEAQKLNHLSSHKSTPRKARLTNSQNNKQEYPTPSTKLKGMQNKSSQKSIQNEEYEKRRSSSQQQEKHQVLEQEGREFLSKSQNGQENMVGSEPREEENEQSLMSLNLMKEQQLPQISADLIENRRIRKKQYSKRSQFEKIGLDFVHLSLDKPDS